MGLQVLITPFEQGLAYAVMAIGVYLTYRVLNFADMTVDGSFPLGAAIAARLITAGTNPFLAALAAIPAGFAAGAVTGFIHTRLKVSGLLAGILTMTALYSVNLRVMGGSNLPLLASPSMITLAQKAGVPQAFAPAAVFAAVTLGLGVLVSLLLCTQYGLAIRATGDNQVMARSQGVNTESVTLFTLGLSNALAALSGALTAQYLGFADIGMGVGTVIAGLASVIIGTAILRRPGVFAGVAGAVAGSALYRFVIAVALRLGLQPTDLKLVTALIVTVSLSLPAVSSKLRLKPIFRTHEEVVRNEPAA